MRLVLITVEQTREEIEHKKREAGASQNFIECTLDKFKNFWYNIYINNRKEK